MKTTEEIKKEIDACFFDCQKRIFEAVDKLGPFEADEEEINRARTLMAQRITNWLWSWSHPNAGHIIYEQMREGVK